MHEVLVNRLGGLILPRKSVVRLTDRPDMTLDVYRGGKSTIQQQQILNAVTVMKAKKKNAANQIHYKNSHIQQKKQKNKQLKPINNGTELPLQALQA